MGHKISKEQIDPGVKDHIMSFVGDVADLETEVNTDIISAVNSLMVDRVDNAENMGKLANAIGEPVTANHTVDEVVEGLGEMLSTFKTNMMNSGVVVESSDKFKSLIDKIKGLTEGEGNKGIKFAEGQATFDADRTLSSNNCYVNYDLDFTPTYLFVKFDAVFNANEWCYNVILTNWCEILINNSAFQLALVDVTDKSCLIADHIGSNDATILADTVYYCAIGVGEEDTTLRDSLASILEEEGVSVTEEDDMSSLISKVDSEFSDKETEMENTKDKLYNLMVNGGYDVNDNMDIDNLVQILENNNISIGDVEHVACGEDYTFIIRRDGSIMSCGYGYYGNLGIETDYTLYSQQLFEKVTKNTSDVKELIPCYNTTYIIKNDGSLWGCGDGHDLGLNTTDKKNIFTKITTDVKQVSAGLSHLMVLKNDGSLWASGSTYEGRLGNGTMEVYDQLTLIKVDDNVNQVACHANSTIILKNDGSLWGCGNNATGQLGLGYVTSGGSGITSFTRITTMSDIKQISCGYAHTIILKNDGSLWGCGDGIGLGLGTTNNQTSFTQITTNISNDVRQVSCGNGFTYIIKNDGSLWACGSNEYGQLGLGTNTTDKTTFTKVTESLDNKLVSCGSKHVCVLKNNGELWICGYSFTTGSNQYGGDGISANHSHYIFNQITEMISLKSF